MSTMSLYGMLGVARDGMLAQEAAIDVTGSNVTNVNTPGYVRRAAVLSARSLASGQQGGVDVASISRAFDQFASSRVVTETGKQAAGQARSDALTSVQSIVAPGAGLAISDKIQKLFDGFTTIATDPSDLTTRTTVLASAEDVAQAFSTAAGGLASQRTDMLKQARDVAGEVNSRLTKIASFDTQIRSAAALGEPASDLRDQRDQLIQEVGQRVDVKAVYDDKGGVTLLSSGSVLEEGGKASSIAVGVAPTGDLSFNVIRPGGASVDISANVTSGTLGGLREARDVDIPSAQNKLDQLAFDFSNSINAAHSAGYGLDGVTGRPIFVPPGAVKGAAYAMAVDPSVKGKPAALGAASAAGSLPGGNDVAIAVAALAYAPLGAGGTPSTTAASIAGDVGIAKQAADSELALRTATVGQAVDLRERSSGVSLDEEMVNMSKFQNAFDASARVLKTVDDLLDEVVKGL